MLQNYSFCCHFSVHWFDETLSGPASLAFPFFCREAFLSLSLTYTRGLDSSQITFDLKLLSPSCKEQHWLRKAHHVPPLRDKKRPSQNRKGIDTFKEWPENATILLNIEKSGLNKLPSLFSYLFSHYYLFKTLFFFLTRKGYILNNMFICHLI